MQQGNRFRFIFKLEEDARRPQLQRLVNKLEYARAGTLLQLISALQQIKQRKDVKPWQWVWYESDNAITWPEHCVPVLALIERLDMQWYVTLERSGEIDVCQWYIRDTFNRLEQLSLDMTVFCWCKIGEPMFPAPVPTAIPI